MSHHFLDNIKTPFEQLPTNVKNKLIEPYLGESVIDLITMYLDSLSAMEIANRVDEVEGFTKESKLRHHVVLVNKESQS